MILTEKQIKKLYPLAVIYKGAEIYKGAVIYEGAEIHEGAVIREGAVIGGNRKDVKNCVVIQGLGCTKRMTAYTCDDGLIINIGCASNYEGLPFKEMKKRISKKYSKEHEYFDALRLIKKWYKNL